MTQAPTPVGPSRRSVVLPAVPGLGGLYARGAASAARLAVARRTGAAPASLPDVELVVRGVEPDPDHLTRYQRLVGESGSDVLPPGFVQVLAFPLATALMARPDFPLSLLGMVHVANHVTQHRPVRLGEALDVRTLARDLRPHRAGAQVDIVAEVTVAGEAVWTGVSTYLAKDIELPRTEPRASDVAEPRASDVAERPPFVAPEPTGRWHLAGDVGRRYAAVSGDRNPIHLSAVTAKALGFPRAIAHGMYTSARALAGVGAARGDAFEWSVDFVKPVLLPSSPSIRIARDDDGFAITLWRAGASAPQLTSRVTPTA